MNIVTALPFGSVVAIAVPHSFVASGVLEVVFCCPTKIRTVTVELQLWVTVRVGSLTTAA
jgi:hypothetical protein